MLHRRSFLTGLLAAPLVIKSGVLMPLRGLAMPYSRWIVDYVIMTDQVVARYDATMRAPLPTPERLIISTTPGIIRQLNERYKDMMADVDARARAQPLAQISCDAYLPLEENGRRVINFSA